MKEFNVSNIWIHDIEESEIINGHHPWWTEAVPVQQYEVQGNGSQAVLE